MLSHGLGPGVCWCPRALLLLALISMKEKQMDDYATDWTLTSKRCYGLVVVLNIRKSFFECNEIRVNVICYS